jgi:hypothetical protein
MSIADDLREFATLLQATQPANVEQSLTRLNRHVTVLQEYQDEAIVSGLVRQLKVSAT